MIKHWNNVGRYISARDKDGIAEYSAGDDTPIYRWQRNNVEKNLIDLFQQFPKESRILEIGSGAGANVALLKKLGFKNIDAYEPSESMREICIKNISNICVYSDLKDIGNTYDIIFTCTCLQHITDDDDMDKILRFIHNIKAKRIILIEDITKNTIQENTWVGRPLSYYLGIMNGYNIISEKYVDFPCVHIFRNISTLFGFLQRSEGATISLFQKYCEKIFIRFQKCIPSCYQGLHLMDFERVRRCLDDY